MRAVISHQSMDVLVWRPSDGAAIVEVACGWKHTVARDSRGRVWGLGGNRRGQLPLYGSSSFDGGAAAAAPDAHSSSGQVRGHGMSGHEPAPTHVMAPALLSVFDAQTKVVKVDAGWSHTVLLAEDGRIQAYGRSDMGQCSPLPGVWDDVCAGSEMLLARRGSELVAVGWNEHGNLGLGAHQGFGNRFSAGSVLVSLASASRVVMSAGGAHCGLLALVEALEEEGEAAGEREALEDEEEAAGERESEEGATTGESEMHK